MNVWTSTDFAGHWPVGTAAVVVAETEDDARALLDEELALYGLGASAAQGYTLKHLPMFRPAAVVLADGNY